MKKITILLCLSFLISCKPTENEESGNCKGKTVLKITESVYSTQVYFTDGSYYEAQTYGGEILYTHYKQK